MKNTIKHTCRNFHIITGVTINGRCVTIWKPIIHTKWRDAVEDLKSIYDSYVIDESDAVYDSGFYEHEGWFAITLKDDTYIEGRINDDSIDEYEYEYEDEEKMED